MYQFTTTTILNSQKDSNGTTDKYTGSASGLNVTRVNFFKKDNIVSVYKRPYQAGVNEVAKITIAASTLGLVNRLVVDVRLSQQTDSEYANFSLAFKKPVVVEILSTGNTTNDATALKNAINGLKDRYGFSYITATSSGADLTLTATNNNQRFWSVIQEEEVALTLNSNSIIQPDYKVLAGGTLNGLVANNGVVLTTVGKVGFGDDEYMIKSIMFPTYENTRHFGTNKEERPIIGGNYTEYVLRYSIVKDGNDGIVSGGNSVTTHVFYVPAANVSTFETELGKVGLSTIFMQANYTATDGILSTGADATDQITVTGAVGAVTYSTTDSTKIAVGATTGLVTTAGKTATGAAVVTVTDALGNTDTVTYDIQA